MVASETDGGLVEHSSLHCSASIFLTLVGLPCGSMQYIINLTMGLISAFFFFLYNVYHLIVSYGEPMLSGLAFFLLVMMAGLATVGTHLGAIYGTVAGGGLFLLKQAAKQAAVKGNNPHGKPRQVPYGMGRSGGFQSQRAHFD